MSKSEKDYNIVWQDREIKFDIHNIHTKLRNGEKVLDVLDYIEDTKGNPGDHGRLLFTNLRIIWYSLSNLKFNLSIGYYCILTMTTKTVLSKLRGTTQALYILTSSHNSRFEFILTNMSSNTTKQFSSVFAIYKLYQSSFLYRELKLRSAIVSGRQLKVLPQEQVYNTVGGIWNLSSDQGNLGTFILTNIRLIWFADINESFNISLPYMQIANISVRESKYGPALVIHTLPTGGSYVLGFRVDPQNRLGEIYKELSSFFSVYSVNPIFGVSYEQKEETINQIDNTISVDDIEEIDDDKKSNEINSKLATYLAESSENGQHREPIYCKELGFAMEKIRDGFTLKDLWEVIPQSMNN